MAIGAVRVANDDREASPAVAEALHDESVPAWVPRVATAAAVVPILVAAIRAVGRGWAPYGDEAYFSVRAWDVFSRNFPLLGTASSGSGRMTERAINHPGPLQFDLLAVPVRALGHTVGTAMGQALLNTVAVVLVAWLVHRVAGRVATTVTMAGVALLVWSMGSEVLYRPWGPYAVVLPFVLYLVAVWCSVAGDRVALVVAVVAGTYCVQTNLSYALLVPGLAALAAGATVLRLVRRDGTSAADAAARRATARGAAVAVAVGAVVWIQPVIEQLTGRQHNLSALILSAGGGGATPGLGPAVRRVAQTVALPRAWLPPTFSSPPYSMTPPPPMSHAAPALAVLVVATALLTWRAHRRESQAIAAAGVTSLAALVLAVITMVRAPLYAGIPFHEILWLWPLGLFVWLVIVLAVMDEWLATERIRFRPRPAAGVACAVALVAGLAALPTRTGVHDPATWAWPSVPAVEDDVLDAVRDKGPILVDIPVPDQAALIGPALLPMLQREQIPFVVSEDSIARTLGERRRYHPGDARWQLTVVGHPNTRPPAGHDLVAQWSAASDADWSEYERLRADLRATLAAEGFPLAPGGTERVVDAGRADLLPLIENARSDPDPVLDGQMLDLLLNWIPAVADGPVIDAEQLPTESITRWIELWNTVSANSVRIYFGPVE